MRFFCSTEKFIYRRILTTNNYDTFACSLSRLRRLTIDFHLISREPDAFFFSYTSEEYCAAVNGRINWSGYRVTDYTAITRLYHAPDYDRPRAILFIRHTIVPASHDTPAGLEYRDISLGTFRTPLMRYRASICLCEMRSRSPGLAYIGGSLSPYRKRVSPRNEGVAFRRIIRRDCDVRRIQARMQFFYTTRNSDWGRSYRLTSCHNYRNATACVSFSFINYMDLMTNSWEAWQRRLNAL